MIVKLLKACRGYVRIKLCGYSPERFMNLCCSRGILLWGMENHGEYYTMYLSLGDFFLLRPIIRKTQTRVVVLERHGLPFFLHKYRKRKLFALGFVFCIVILYILSLFIWEISIEGNYTLTADVLTDYLKEEGIRAGMPKSGVDCGQIEEKLRAKYNNITWTSARLDGTRLVIGIKENLVDVGMTKEEEEPSSLAAEKAGTIVSIITRSGTPMVGPGDQVAAGDILVSGQIPVLNDDKEIFDYEYVRADADIVMQTSYFYRDVFDRGYEDKLYTGEARKEYCLNVGEKAVSFMPGKMDFKDYDILEDKRQLRIGGGLTFPVWLKTREFKEYEIKKKTYSQEECKALSNAHFKRFYKSLREKGVQILQNSVKIKISDSKCTAEGELILQETPVKETPVEIAAPPAAAAEEEEPQ